VAGQAGKPADHPALHADWMLVDQPRGVLLLRDYPPAICRGSVTSVRQLTAAIGTFIDHWNDRPRPFAWTKDADEILASINRAKTKTNVLTGH
jgi:hypothetical protein